MQIELLTHDQGAGHDLTARLAKVLLVLDEPVTMKRVLVDDPELPELALRLGGEVYALPKGADEEELLELLDDPSQS